MSKTNHEYISLHSHSEGSLLDGHGSIDDYVNRTVELGQRGLGITDHGKTFMIFDLIKKCNAAGISPIPGCEFYVAPENPQGAFAQEPIFYRGGAQGDVSRRGSYLHMTVWAYNQVGLHNLMKLSTLSHDVRRVYSTPRIDFDLLAEHSEGLIVATGCPSSEISTRFRLGQDDKAYEYASRLYEVFGKDRLFVEIMNHGMKQSLERDLLPKQLKLAKKMGLKLLATNDSHYTSADDCTSHEEMLALQSGSSMLEEPEYNGGTRFAFEGNQYYLKSTQEMLDLFPHEDFPNAISNTLLVAEMAEDIRLDYDRSLRPTPHIPNGYTEESYMKKLIQEGFKERFGNAPREIQNEARKNIKHEFHVLQSSDFLGIILVVREYIDWAKQNYSTLDAMNNILALPTGPGRGSVGGSTIAYCLGISETNPIRFELMFERFLSEGRGATYEISYDDGTTETRIASDEMNTLLPNSDEASKIFAHKLQIGDEVVVDSDEN